MSAKRCPFFIGLNVLKMESATSTVHSGNYAHDSRFVVYGCV